MASMLTTVDNPFDPFVEFDEWLAFDMSQGYNSSSYLARMVATSKELSRADQDLAIEWAIDQIVQENPNGMYRKVSNTETTEPFVEF